MKKQLTLISVIATTYGIGAFILGSVVGSIDWLQVGLLAMILGEVMQT